MAVVYDLRVLAKNVGNIYIYVFIIIIIIIGITY